MNTLDRGARMMEILKQDQYAPLPVEEQVVVLYFATRDYAHDIAVKDIVRVESELLQYMRDFHGELLQRIRTEKKLSDELEEALRGAIEEFKSRG